MFVVKQVQDFLADLNQATLSGAIDIVVVRAEDGTLRSSPFHVNFGKFQGIFRPKHKVVAVHVNGVLQKVNMKLGSEGTATFVHERPLEVDTSTTRENDDCESLTSPLASPLTTPQLRAVGFHTLESVEHPQDETEHLDLGMQALALARTDSDFSASSIESAGSLEWDPCGPAWSLTEEREDEPVNDRQNSIDSTHSAIPKTTTSTSTKHVKSLRPTSEQLDAMHLHAGENTISFTVLSGKQECATVSASVFLLSHDAKLVVVNIDGAITRSRMLGRVIPQLGGDWSHQGVARLLSAVQRNGYHVLYLTSRAIGLSNSTKSYLTDLSQDGIKLPNGPILSSPSRFISSLTRDVFFDNAECKTRSLQNVRMLFSHSDTPFYAGFAHSDTDQRALRTVHVPASRVFLTDKESNIKRMNRAHKSTYDQLWEMSDSTFPPHASSRWHCPSSPTKTTSPARRIYEWPSSPCTSSSRSTSPASIRSKIEDRTETENETDLPVSVRLTLIRRSSSRGCEDERFNHVNYWKTPLPNVS